MNLAYSQAVWTRFMREIAFFLKLWRCVKELEDRCTFEAVQTTTKADPNSNFTDVTIAGLVDFGTNTTAAGEIIWRVTGAGPYAVKGYKATGGGAGDEVVSCASVAAGATGTLSAANSSGLTGTVTLAGSVTAETTDVHRSYVWPDFRNELFAIWTGTDSVEDDSDSRAAALATINAMQSTLRGLRRTIRDGLKLLLLSAPNNPKARGNAFLKSAMTDIIAETPNDDDGAVTRLVDGIAVRLRLCMEDEATGGEQDVVKITPTVGSASFSAKNLGTGTTLAAPTASENVPPSVWAFYCTKGVDTGDLGAERFAVVVALTGSPNEALPRIEDGPVVDRDWTGPFGVQFKLVRTWSKTGDNSHLTFANVTVSRPSTTGLTNANTAAGVLNWTSDGTTINFYKAAQAITSNLVATASGVTAGATCTAVPANGSGLTVVFVAGSAPTTGSGTLLANGFVTQNTSLVPDEFSITITRATAFGVFQALWSEAIRDGFVGHRLNSDTSGSESIPDTLVKNGTFHPYETLRA